MAKMLVLLSHQLSKILKNKMGHPVETFMKAQFLIVCFVPSGYKILSVLQENRVNFIWMCNRENRQ